MGDKSVNDKVTIKMFFNGGRGGSRTESVESLFDTSAKKFRIKSIQVVFPDMEDKDLIRMRARVKVLGYICFETSYAGTFNIENAFLHAKDGVTAEFCLIRLHDGDTAIIGAQVVVTCESI